MIIGRRHVVHCQEVRPVDDVFGEVLKTDPDPVGVHPPRRPLCAVISIQGHLVLRSLAAGVGPDEDPVVALSDNPRAGRHPRRLAVETWDLHQPALAVEAPPVEWADDAVVADPTTEAQMGAQMWAVGVEDPHHAVLTPERNELAIQVVQVGYYTNLDVLRGPDAEPAIGDCRKGITIRHGAVPTRSGTCRRRSAGGGRHS